MMFPNMVVMAEIVSERVEFSCALVLELSICKVNF